MAAPQVAQGRIHALRQTIAKIDGSLERRDLAQDARGDEPCAGDRLALGIEPFDAALGGGLAIGGLTEIRGNETRAWGAPCAFALMLLARLGQQRGASSAWPLDRPLVWIADPEARREGGEIWLPGFRSLWPDIAWNQPGNSGLLLVRPKTPLEALWAAETAIASNGVGAVILELRENPRCFGLKESRRLHFRARENRNPLILLRQAGEAEAGAAPARFLIGPAPAGLKQLAPDIPLAGSLGPPGLIVTLEKSRHPAPLTLQLEWSPHECRFNIRSRSAFAAEPPFADGAPACSGEPAHSGSRLSAVFDRPDHQAAARPALAFDRTG